MAVVVDFEVGDSFPLTGWELEGEDMFPALVDIHSFVGKGHVFFLKSPDIPEEGEKVLEDGLRNLVGSTLYVGLNEVDVYDLVVERYMEKGGVILEYPGWGKGFVSNSEEEE